MRLWITGLAQAILFSLFLLFGSLIVTAGTGQALLLIASAGVVNAAVRPLLVRITGRSHLLLYFPLALLVNLGFLWLAAVTPGVFIETGWPAVAMAALLAAANVTTGTLLAIDDDEPYFQHLVRPILKQRPALHQTDVPGVLFLEIDGLAAPILRRAMETGHMPTMARWLASGSHRLATWECDFSSQTSASQAGILLGDNFDIPAFRWYEKESGRLMVSNHPTDAIEIERRLASGDGLLAGGGTSRSNVFSGDAQETIFTFSTILNAGKHRARPFYPLLVRPYNVLRVLLLFLWDRWLEWRAARHQRRHDIRPRMDRGGIYPWVRAATTVILRELNQYAVVGDILAGVPSVYATYFGYDEVAHHSGIERPDALAVLKGIDAQFDRLERFVQRAPRPYHLVVLSDHGQSQGATFLQKYGLSLSDVVRQLTGDRHSVAALQTKDGGWGKASVIFTDLLNDIIAGDNGFVARRLRQMVGKHSRIVGEYEPPQAGLKRVFVELRPDGQASEEEDAEAAAEPAELVVLASGNLGLIYCTQWTERLTLEQMNAAFPGLIPGLSRHEGIGFLLVRSEDNGPLAMGAAGIHYLRDGRVEGEDPLAGFSPHAAAHLLRTDGFPHVADIMVNSAYDEEREEIAAFEELVGSHGGMGGLQSHAFLLYPAAWQLEDAPIVGTAQLHRQLKRWVKQASRAAIK